MVVRFVLRGVAVSCLRALRVTNNDRLHPLDLRV